MLRLHLTRSIEVIIDFFARLGITINPYFIFFEQISDGGLPHIEIGFEEYSIDSLGPQHMKTIAAMPGRKPSEEELIARLNEGKI